MDAYVNDGWDTRRCHNKEKQYGNRSQLHVDVEGAVFFCLARREEETRLKRKTPVICLRTSIAVTKVIALGDRQSYVPIISDHNAHQREYRRRNKDHYEFLCKSTT